MPSTKPMPERPPVRQPAGFEQLGRTCRHFSGLNAITGERNCCAIGHPILKIVVAANGGSDFGIAYMFPCRPGPERKADCPNYDPRSDAEIEAGKAALSAQMDRLVQAMPVFANLRATMVQGRIARQVVDCPFCNEPNRLHVTFAIDSNNHLSAQCAACGDGFVE